jgi:2-phosphoglycerate kinase
MNAIDSKIRILFSQAYILGGSPCSGKSTIAERLASQYNLQYYKVDDHDQEHTRRAQPDRHPVMFTYSTMSWNAIWLRPVPLQVQEEFAYYRERFEMIVQDLEQYDVGTPIILEGAAYFPDLIRPYHDNPQKVIYLVPTKDFQVHHYQQRPWIKHILKDCDNPRQALENWMMRDHLFGQEVLRQAQAHHYQTIVVDGKQSIDEQFESVTSYWRLATQS